MRALERPWGVMHVRAETTGDGPAVVFLNSLGTDLRMWDLALPHVTGVGHVLRMDFRGHGLSAIDPAPYSIADLASDVAALLDQAEARNAVVVGCSVGGLVAQRLALDAPDRVSALVLSNTAPRLGTPAIWRDRVAGVRAHGMADMAGDILRRWFGAAYLDRPEAALWQALLARSPADGYVALCDAIAAEDLSDRVGAIRAPCLVIAGEADQSTPAAKVADLARAIPGAAFVEFQGVGHIPAIEVPHAFGGAVSDFIRGHTE